MVFVVEVIKQHHGRRCGWGVELQRMSKEAQSVRDVSPSFGQYSKKEN